MLPAAGILIVLAICIGIAGFAFWIWMLVDAITKQEKDVDKIVWVLVILFASFLGAAVYYFAAYRPRVLRAGR